MGLGPTLFILGVPGTPLSTVEFCLNIVNLTNAIGIASGVKLNENVSEFWQYFMKKVLQNFISILAMLFLTYYL